MRVARAMPPAIGICPETMALQPNSRSPTWLKCMEPPFPLHKPLSLPKSSAIMAFTSQPAAIAAPWPR